MLRRRVWLVRSLTFLTVWSIACWAGRCEAYESWKGRVTARVNVRQAPGETSNIITQIDEGVEVTISDEREAWFKVVVEEDTFGFIGWVYGKYIRNPTAVSSTSSPSPADRKKTGILSSKPATPIASYVASTETPPKDRPGGGGTSGEAFEKSAPAEEKASPVVKQKEIASEPQIERAGNVVQQDSLKKFPEKKEAAQPALGKEMPEDRLPPYEVPLQKGSEEVEKRHVSTPEASTRATRMSHVVPIEKEAAPPVRKLSVPSRKNDPVIAVPEKKVFPGKEATGADDSKQGQGLRALAGVVVKLVVVAFSCLALIFAYRAWETTRARKGGQRI